MRRIMCVQLTAWPTDRVTRRRPALRAKPLVLTAVVARRTIVIAACARARAEGVRAGMTLAEASAMCRGLVHRSHNANQDRRGLEALGRWMMSRISAQVALQPPDALLVEVGGSARLFGSVDVIARRTAASLVRLNLSAMVSVAPTAGAACALAATRQRVVVTESDLLSVLGPLPVHTLRIDLSIADALHHVGIDTIGQLLAIPRAVLPARFGEQLLERLDQATGRRSELLPWLTHQRPLCERLAFEVAVDSLEVIGLALQELVARVVVQLCERGSGASQLIVKFEQERMPPIVKTVTLSRPSRDPRNLLDLLRLATESLRAHDGFIAIELAAPVLQLITPEQTSFIPEEANEGAADLASLIERIRAKLGDAAVVQPKLVESHIPEYAYTWVATHIEPEATATPRLPRPLMLLPTPVEIGVIVSPSEDRDGRPISFTHEAQVHRLRLAVGPERIAGAWWTGHDKIRDYFDVEDEAGRRFWVFRVVQTSKWYLHGQFA